jgi:diguanylate cyclase (GGDEF)-like protein
MYDVSLSPTLFAMELFALDADVAALEDRLETLHGMARIATLVSLAWHHRQRDCGRALLLADEADQLLAQFDVAQPALRVYAARSILTRAEVKWLLADLPGAQELTQLAREVFDELGDRIGIGDAHWIEASIWSDRGDEDQVDACISLAITQYGLAGNQLRVDTAQARRLVYSSFRDPTATQTALQLLFPAGARRPTSLTSWVATARANVAGLTEDPGSAIKHDLEAYHAALDSGQLRQAMVSVTNAAETFAMLGELNAALEWTEQALIMARKAGWPSSVGVCLMQLGNVLRLLDRHDEASASQQEALILMEPLAGSRNYEQVLGNMAQIALDVGDYITGLRLFTEFEERVTSHREPDLLIKAWRGQASALIRLGRPQEANAKATAALATARAQGNAEGQIQVLSVCATLHAAHDLPPPQGMTAPTAELHYLDEALRIAANISGYTILPELLDQVASAYAACGEFHAAYESALAAKGARSSKATEQAQKRALAMRIRTEIEGAQAETAHQRRLAETMKDMAATLETLGKIGREITASLNANAVFTALHRHVHQLLDATFFAVYLIDHDQATLRTAFGIEAGATLPIITTALDSPTSMFARCVRERREIAIDRATGVDDPNLIPGTLPSCSLLYAPLMAGERLLGAMSIQSPRQHAYGERERSIFRTLCAYGAIALDNAAAYSAAETSQQRADQALGELRETQAQLLAKNKELEQLAVTDQLTGLYNRLRLNQALNEERARQQRHTTNFCVLMLDIDEFKSVNDTFGHQVGDEVLIGIARVLQANIRAIDLLGRWGGEEFLVVCRETAIGGALVLAEKLRSAINGHVFTQVPQRSISVGVAMFHLNEAPTETISRADAALYRAKQGGRNRVECGESILP